MATDAIVVRDLNYRLKYWNKGAERLYGWKAEEVIGNARRAPSEGELSREKSLVRQAMCDGALGLSTSVMDTDRRRILDAGFDGYVPKPVNLRELLGTVQKMTT